MYQIENLYRNPITQAERNMENTLCMSALTNFNSRLVINFMIHNVLTLKIIE